MPKKESATVFADRRKGDRRLAAERRGRIRIEPDRRRGFGRREVDTAAAAALEQELLAALDKAEALGPEDPSVALALNDLGLFYYRANRDAEAEPLHKRALEIQEKALGSTHADVVQTLHNLAALYYAQDRYADSEALLKRALEILREVRGNSRQSQAEPDDTGAE